MSHKKSFFEKIVTFFERIIVIFWDNAIPYLARSWTSARDWALIFIYSMVSFIIILIIIAIVIWKTS